MVANRNEFVKKHNIASYRNRDSLPKKLHRETYVMVDKDGYKMNMDEKMIKSFRRGVNDCEARDHAEYYSIKGSKGKQILSVFSMNVSEKYHTAILQHGYTEQNPHICFVSKDLHQLD